MSDFDLFGNVVRSGFGQKGRPPYEVSDEKRNKVMMLLAAGWTVERVAGAMNITKPTLRKYFVSELRIADVALDRLEAARMSMVFEKAKSGDIGAMKELRRDIEQMRAREADRMFDGRRRPSEKPEPIGKKEAKRIAAHEVGGVFAPPAGPEHLDG